MTELPLYGEAPQGLKIAGLGKMPGDVPATVLPVGKKFCMSKIDTALQPARGKPAMRCGLWIRWEAVLEKAALFICRELRPLNFVSLLERCQYIRGRGQGRARG